jgi:regulatory protein
MKNQTDRAKKLPKKATRSHLENVALYYVERFSSTADSLRNVLNRRVHRSAHYHETDVAQGLNWVVEIVERFQGAGLIDDASFAQARARTLHQRGNSAKVITLKLRAKGVSGTLIELALENLETDCEPGTSSEHQAAIRLARRRRLGPYGDHAQRLQNRDKHMAALARAGFSYDIARRVIDDEMDNLEI